MPKPDIEDVIRAAAAHGEDSEADMEVGDLQEALRAAWRCMDSGARSRFIASAEVNNVLEFMP